MILLILPVVLIAIIVFGFPLAAATAGLPRRQMTKRLAQSIGWALLAATIWVLCARFGASSAGGSGAVSVVGAAEGFVTWGLVGLVPPVWMLVMFVRALRRQTARLT